MIHFFIGFSTSGKSTLARYYKRERGSHLYLEIDDLWRWATGKMEPWLPDNPQIDADRVSKNKLAVVLIKYLHSMLGDIAVSGAWPGEFPFDQFSLNEITIYPLWVPFEEARSRFVTRGGTQEEFDKIFSKESFDRIMTRFDDLVLKLADVIKDPIIPSEESWIVPWSKKDAAESTTTMDETSEQHESADPNEQPAS